MELYALEWYEKKMKKKREKEINGEMKENKKENKYACLYKFIRKHRELQRAEFIKWFEERHPYCEECERGDKDELCSFHRNEKENKEAVGTE